MKQVTEDSYIIKVGDIITATHAFGVNKYTITRVTKKFAYAKVNDSYVAKFKLIYKAWAFSTLPRGTYDNTTYKLYSK